MAGGELLLERGAELELGLGRHTLDANIEDPDGAAAVWLGVGDAPREEHRDDARRVSAARSTPEGECGSIDDGGPHASSICVMNCFMSPSIMRLRSASLYLPSRHPA